jgi:hypothetical protein
MRDRRAARSTRALPAVAFLGLAVLLAGCGDAPPRFTTLAGDGFSVRYDREAGTFDVTLADGSSVLEGACATVEVRGAGTHGTLYRTSDGYSRTVTTSAGSDALGAAQRLEAVHRGLQGAPDLTLRLAVYPGAPFFTIAVEAANAGASDMVLNRLGPASVEAARGGALRLGAHPSTHRILEDGSFFLYDFFVDVVPGDAPQPPETVGLAMVHGGQLGHSVSNWNHAIKDLVTGRGFVAGTLDFEHASPFFNTSFAAEEAVAVDGRTPFTYWAADFPYLPNGKPLAVGERLAAGPVLVIPDTDRPHEGLERYAAAVKQWNGITLWTERGADHRVPTGWNSWGGSTSSGGYGASIDQQLMLDNLAVMATEFRDFGGEWFQIDDGYEAYYGDWDWRTDRFPDGAPWLADQIGAAGLLPGVWIAPFQVDALSATYAAHEADGWFAERLPLVSGDKPILDLTHPDVLAWVTERFRTVRAAGYRWVKVDFAYWALGAAKFHDPTATREEAFRRGLAAIRDGLAAGATEAGGAPGDTFWVSVAMVGPNAGFADSLRPNLDTMPAWDKEKESQGRIDAQGFKPTVRTLARRYYLHGQVYLFNHDMIFFRSLPDASVPPITRDESRCLVTAIGLSGGVAKLGERLVDMPADWINDYRVLLPVFGQAARPLDLFEREFAEAWHLHVDPAAGRNTGGDGPPYDVVALFNWGTNDDLTQSPSTPLADEAREVSVDLGAIGLDPATDYVGREFWSGEVVDGVRGTFARTVAPHTVQLFALRPVEAHPQYLGGNRHLLQGAVEVRGVSWSEDQHRLSVAYDAAPGTVKAPFEHQLFFRLPAGWSLGATTVDGATDLRTDVADGVLTVTFTVATRAAVQVVLDFVAP